MVFKRFFDFLQYWYFQYTLATAVYMLEPIERKVVREYMTSQYFAVSKLRRIFMLNSVILERVKNLYHMFKTLVDSVLVGIIAIGLYSAFLFLPGHAVMMKHFFDHIFMEDNPAGSAQTT